MEIYPLPVAEFARIWVFASREDPNSGEFGYGQRSPPGECQDGAVVQFPTSARFRTILSKVPIPRRPIVLSAGVKAGITRLPGFLLVETEMRIKNMAVLAIALFGSAPQNADVLTCNCTGFCTELPIGSGLFEAFRIAFVPCIAH